MIPVPEGVVRRWMSERGEAWREVRTLREQRDMARNEVDRLRARVAELEAAGDRMARELDGACWFSGVDALEAWWSVRGDAPTQPPIPLVRDQAVDTIVAFAHRNAVNEDGYVRVLNALGDLGVADDEIDRARPDLDEDAQDDARRTDGQPPADDTGWTSVCDELHLDADAPASAVVDRLRLLKSRYEQLSEAAGHEVPVDGLTAEQYRHIYTDLIRGLAVDLGLDPDMAGGGSVTAAVRRLVAGDTAAPDGPPTTVTVTLPAAEHDIDGEDDHGRWTQNPGWETRGVESGLMSAWAQGVSVEDVLYDADDGDVVELEETAHKVLAAVAWHRHYARLTDTTGGSAPASTDGDQR